MTHHHNEIGRCAVCGDPVCRDSGWTGDYQLEGKKTIVCENCDDGLSVDELAEQGFIHDSYRGIEK